MLKTLYYAGEINYNLGDTCQTPSFIFNNNNMVLSEMTSSIKRNTCLPNRLIVLLSSNIAKIYKESIDTFKIIFF